MATAVERPFLALGEASNSHGPRHSGPIEIIDVDLLDDDDEVQVVGSRQPSRPVAGSSRRSESRRRAPETISLLDDSDDEAPLTASARRVERRRLFSPPPPRQNVPFVMIPPPVPRVPPQYVGHTSMIPRQGSRVGPPPPVQPLDRTFAFNLGRTSSSAAGPSRQQPTASTSNPQEPTPRISTGSNNVPRLGLGGALLANNRARVAHEHRHPQEAATRTDTFFGIPQAFQRIYPGAISPFVHLLGASDAHPFDEEEHGFADFLFRHRERFRQPLTEKEHYKPVYTHPTPAEPGFTYDFAPESSTGVNFPPTSKSDPIIIIDEQTESNSKENVNTLLVCARCQDPLVMNTGLTGSDSSQRKIWALRCGHLVDGKCLTEIGQPLLAVDYKGKGKAKEEIPYGEDGALPNSGQDANSTTNLDSSIRSRLRSRAHISTQNGASSSDYTPPSPTSRKRKLGQPGGKVSPNKKRKVEEQYEWGCPVHGCGKAHVSVKIGGVWGPEKERQLKGKKGGWRFGGAPETEARGVIQVFA